MNKNSFINFAKAKSDGLANNGANGQQNGQNTPQQTNTEKDMSRAYKNYSNMNEQQLMQEMFRAAKSSKQTGQLTPDELQKFYNQASPMLTPQQRNKLKNLMNTLKNEI